MRNLENFSTGTRFRIISNNADNGVHMYVDVYYLTRYLEFQVVPAVALLVMCTVLWWVVEFLYLALSVLDLMLLIGEACSAITTKQVMIKHHKIYVNYLKFELVKALYNFPANIRAKHISGAAYIFVQQLQADHGKLKLVQEYHKSCQFTINTGS